MPTYGAIKDLEQKQASPAEIRAVLAPAMIKQQVTYTIKPGDMTTKAQITAMDIQLAPEPDRRNPTNLGSAIVQSIEETLQGLSTPASEASTSNEQTWWGHDLLQSMQAAVQTFNKLCPQSPISPELEEYLFKRSHQNRLTLDYDKQLVKLRHIIATLQLGNPEKLAEAIEADKYELNWVNNFFQLHMRVGGPNGEVKGGLQFGREKPEQEKMSLFKPNN